LTPVARTLILKEIDPSRILDLKQIRQIVALMNEHGLTYFHLEKKDYNIKLKKGVDPEALGELLRVLPGPVPPAAAPAAPPAAGEADPTELATENGEAITSPMVGTFYRKPSPDADDFVSVGATVSEGQTICIIEAMKVMNEIKAERGGTITEILIEDSTPVQYGDILFRIK
jgi:oxaloacetate decarboxylase alpha subunit/acetyl-CoA carboxylase biotin carboxyl carrier protein